MSDTSVSFRADNADRRATPWMEWIGDFDLNRRNAGSMSLLRPAAAKAISRPP
jgi:hypothetical protein